MVAHDIIADAVVGLLPNSKLLYLFGSQATSSATSMSDIDIAVLLPQKLDPIERFEYQEKLASLFSRDLDLVDLLSASTVLQHQVIQTGTLLRGNATEQTQFEMQVLSMYQRLNEERSAILEQYQQ